MGGIPAGLPEAPHAIGLGGRGGINRNLAAQPANAYRSISQLAPITMLALSQRHVPSQPPTIGKRKRDNQGWSVAIGSQANELLTNLANVSADQQKTDIQWVQTLLKAADERATSAGAAETTGTAE